MGTRVYVPILNPRNRQLVALGQTRPWSIGQSWSAPPLISDVDLFGNGKNIVRRLQAAWSITLRATAAGVA